MHTVLISDVTMKTLAAGEGRPLSFREKLELAKLLDRLGVPVIEAEGIEKPKADALRIKSIASAVKESELAVPVTLDEENIAAVWAALGEAVSPRLQVPAAVSPVQMEYIYHKKPAAMLDAVAAAVSACRARTENVEFIAEDATRADPAFLVRALETAIGAGAVTVTLSDTAGQMLPEEFAAFIERVYDAVPALKTVRLGVACANTLSMADACAAAAVSRGAVELKAAAYGTSTACVQNLARLLHARADAFGADTSVHTYELSRGTEQIARLCTGGSARPSLFDSAPQTAERDLTLSAQDAPETVGQAVTALGYELGEEDLAAVYAEFQKIAARKAQIDARELDAIVAAAAMQAPPAYTLKSYLVNSGNVISSTATVKLERDGKETEGVALGDGPIDAAFHALEQVIGCHYELDDSQIRAVTEGKEPMGETVVRLRNEGRLYSGRGISTDIIGASIQAYVNALNKIVYEEAEG